MVAWCEGEDALIQTRLRKNEMAFANWRLNHGLPAAWLVRNPADPGKSVSPGEGLVFHSFCQTAISWGTISFLCFCYKLYLVMDFSCIVKKPRHL